MKIMPIDGIDDFDLRLQRQDAFWEGELLDRPCVHITFLRDRNECPVSRGRHKTVAAKWMDVEFQAFNALASVKNTVYMGDALPVQTPNLGPDYFASLYGGNLIFEDTTSYLQPFLSDWENVDNLVFSLDSPYCRKMDELYNAYIEIGKNTFYTGWPDLHPGADCLAGMRGPQNLAMDLYDHPETIKEKVAQVTADFLKVYDYYYEKLIDAGQACTGWPEIVSTKKWHVSSNDFSFMIGPDLFNRFFLNGLRMECNHMQASLHHLDGSGCLKHLEELLLIENLNAVQWVWGAGNGEVTDWIDVYKKIQAAGKGVQIYGVLPRDLETLMEQLSPEGVWMKVEGIKTEEEGNAILDKVKRWK